MMLVKLAWRNIWRNRRRSVIVMTSVAVGVIATVLFDTLGQGMVLQMLNNQIGMHVAHLQIHRRGFHDNPDVRSVVPNLEAVQQALAATAGIAAAGARVLTYGLASSARTSSGALIVGIDPASEQKVTTIKQSLVEGTYLSGAANEAVVGKALAEKLGVAVGERIVTMASAVDGHVGSDAFRIVGLFETMSSAFDKSTLYIPIANAQAMLGLGQNVSEFAVVVEQRESLQSVQAALQQALGEEYEVLSYLDILPLLVLQVDITRQSMVIFYLIVGIALIFGIINTMLMSVFERIHEFGVLKAIGMRDGSIVAMVLSEAFMLGVIGTAVGFGIGYGIYLPLSRTGLDLGMFSEGLRSWGIGAVIYPVLTWEMVIVALSIIPIIAVIGALYPALRTVRLQPVEAIRYV